MTKKCIEKENQSKMIFLIDWLKSPQGSQQFLKVKLKKKIISRIFQLHVLAISNKFMVIQKVYFLQKLKTSMIQQTNVIK